MFGKVLNVLAAASLLFVGYLMLKAYRPQWFSWTKTEAFKQKPQPVPAPIPAPAPVIYADPPEPERTVAPAGPNAPAAKAPPAPPKISPEASPIDPYESENMQAPIKDTVTYPEMSFGPGVENKATNKGVESGAASSVSNSSFSPEYAQNGGSFMGSVFANDLQPGDDYASA
jgi:hypothetical protein